MNDDCIFASTETLLSSRFIPVMFAYFRCNLIMCDVGSKSGGVCCLKFLVVPVFFCLTSTYKFWWPCPVDLQPRDVSILSRFMKSTIITIQTITTLDRITQATSNSLVFRQIPSTPCILSYSLDTWDSWARINRRSTLLRQWCMYIYTLLHCAMLWLGHPRKTNHICLNLSQLLVTLLHLLCIFHSFLFRVLLFFLFFSCSFFLPFFLLLVLPLFFAIHCPFYSSILFFHHVL